MEAKVYLPINQGVRLKKYQITVLFNDQGTFSREIEAKTKAAAEKEFFEDLPTSVLDNVVKTVVVIKPK